jgi:hypothetical protein
VRNSHDLFDLGMRLETLGHMHIHLVTIKICIIGRCYCQVQSERRVRKYLDFMAHDGHLMERGLSVEQDEISIAQMSLNFVSILQMCVTSVQ